MVNFMIDSSWMLASLVAKVVVEEGRYISIVQGNSPVDRNRNRREKKVKKTNRDKTLEERDEGQFFIARRRLPIFLWAKNL